MALLFAEGFEHYGAGSLFSGSVRNAMLAGAWSAVDFPMYIYDNSSSYPARTGNRAMWGPQVTDNRVEFKGTTHNEVGCALGMYLSVMPSTESASPGFTISDENNTTIVYTRVNPNGSVELRRGSTVLGITDPGLITAQAWHHYELRVLQDNVVGEVELRINGNLELLVNNLDLGTVKPRFWRIAGSGSSTVERGIDDLILWDTTGDVNNTFFGPARVNTIWLDGDEPGNQWSITGAASGADALKETAPDGDTSYISAAINNMKSDFSLESLPPEAEVISGVYIPTMAKLAVAGVGSMKTSMVSAGAVSEGKDVPLTAAYTYRGDVFETDPATGLPWTKNGLENALVRVEKTA